MSVACETENPLVRKLLAFAKLTGDDRRVLNKLGARARQVPARTDLIREGEDPCFVYLVLDGFACRYKLLPDGRRQIMAYLVPGDFCDLHVFILKEMDHGLATLSPCSVVDIERTQILSLLERPAIARAFRIAAMVDEATLCEWLVNLGQRPAEQRVAHLLCELLFRLKAVGLANGESYDLPITQVELADTMGLSGVHINRVLQTLRRTGLITFNEQHLVIHEVDRLVAFAGFNPNYLHLDQRRGEPTGYQTVR